MDDDAGAKDDAQARREFSFTEYREAANAYFKGVDIGYLVVRYYVTINVLMLALMTGLAGQRLDKVPGAHFVIKLMPWIALGGLAMLVLVIRHYFDHLENCRKRCEEIEQIYGGRFFTRLGEIARRRRGRNTVLGLAVIVAFMLILWGYFIVRLWNW